MRHAAKDDSVRGAGRVSSRLKDTAHGLVRPVGRRRFVRAVRRAGRTN